jgi:hypothetical protein
LVAASQGRKRERKCTQKAANEREWAGAGCDIKPNYRLRADAQRRGIAIACRSAAVGGYFVDLLVEDAILVESNTVRVLDRMQCIDGSRATGLRLCLSMNFATPCVEVRRVVLDL